MSKLRGITTLRIGGKERKLRFRAYEIGMLEEKMKKPIGAIFDGGVGMQFVAKAIMVGLDHGSTVRKAKREHITERTVYDWIDDHGDFQKVLEIVTEAIADGLPVKKEEDEPTPVDDISDTEKKDQ